MSLPGGHQHQQLRTAGDARAPHVEQQFERRSTPAVRSVCPCVLSMVHAKQTLTGNCRRLKKNGKLLGMRGMRGMNTAHPVRVNVCAGSPEALMKESWLLRRHTTKGCGVGEAVFIPRIPLIPSNFPFRFKRPQFPMSFCFTMTIDESQRHTLRAAGVDRRSSCFLHGQLYVGGSRVTICMELFVLMPAGKT